MWKVEKCGKVYGVSGEVGWREGEGCGERNGGSVVKCVEVWGPNTLSPTLPISPPSPFLTSPLPTPHPDTLSYTFSHISSHISPSSPHNPTHFPTPISTSPSPSQSVAKLPCDKVFVAKIIVAKLLATILLNRLQGSRKHKELQGTL